MLQHESFEEHVAPNEPRFVYIIVKVYFQFNTCVIISVRKIFDDLLIH